MSSFFCVNCINRLGKCLDASLVSTLKRTRLEDLNAKAKEDYKKKYKKMKESLKNKVCRTCCTRTGGLTELLSSDEMRVMIGKTKIQKNWTVFSQNINVEMPWKSWSPFPS